MDSDRVVSMCAKHRGKVQDKKTQKELVKREQARRRLSDYLEDKKFREDFYL